MKKQENRDLTRFDLDFDLPEQSLPEFFNLLQGLKLTDQEKKDLVAFMRAL